MVINDKMLNTVDTPATIDVADSGEIHVKGEPVALKALDPVVKKAICYLDESNRVILSDDWEVKIEGLLGNSYSGMVLGPRHFVFAFGLTAVKVWGDDFYLWGQRMGRMPEEGVVTIQWGRKVEGLLPVGDNEPGYLRLKEKGEKENGVVAQLEKIRIENVSIQGLSVSEAFEYLRKKVVGDKEGGVINLVIRGSDRNNRKSTIRKKNMTYAEAVDAICVQTGWSWGIDFNELSGAPILVLTKTNNGQQE